MDNQNQTGITLSDIANMVQVIDTVSTRGAFRGEELAPVGILRNRLIAFLEANQISKEDPTDDTEKADTEE